jgi:hypothetical protein
VIFPPLIDAGSTSRYVGPIIFSAILNASAEIVKDELTPKEAGTIPPSTM